MAGGGGGRLLGRGLRKDLRCMLTVLLRTGLKSVQKGKGVFGPTNHLRWGWGALLPSSQRPLEGKELSGKKGRGSQY